MPMENKLFLKKYLIATIIVLVVMLSLFYIISVYNYKLVTINYNKKIDNLLGTIKENYPDITENELMDIINNPTKSSSFVQKYGINIQNEAIITENNQIFQKDIIINTSLLIITFLILLLIFWYYNLKKDQEIAKITKLVNQINHHNYELTIEDISEDELSILKEEVYKTTLMLKEQAEKSQLAKKDLKDSLANISHQLKTPLTSILIMLDNLIDNMNMDNAKKEEFLRNIKREIININFLVQNILKLSKLETNTINFSKKNILVKEIISETLKNVSIICELKNVQIAVNNIEDLKIYCDLKWFVEALTNILKNSIEYAPSNSIIDITVTKNKLYVEIDITDQGRGISQKDLPHIFKRFYRGENAHFESVGIGLALAKMIIEAHNGLISVVSNSKGTTFKIKYFN